MLRMGVFFRFGHSPRPSAAAVSLLCFLLSLTACCSCASVFIVVFVVVCGCVQAKAKTLKEVETAVKGLSDDAKKHGELYIKFMKKALEKVRRRLVASSSSSRVVCWVMVWRTYMQLPTITALHCAALTDTGKSCLLALESGRT